MSLGNYTILVYYIIYTILNKIKIILPSLILCLVDYTAGFDLSGIFKPFFLICIKWLKMLDRAKPVVWPPNKGLDKVKILYFLKIKKEFGLGCKLKRLQNCSQGTNLSL